MRMLRIGIDTHAITSHFALPLLIRHPGGLVAEMTDGTAEYNAAYHHHEGFYYDLVKAAVHRMTIAQAHELATVKVPHFCISESPAFTGRAVTALACDPQVARWSGQVVSTGQLAPLYGFTDTDGTQPDFWRHVVEVQDKGLPANDHGYR